MIIYGQISSTVHSNGYKVTSVDIDRSRNWVNNEELIGHEVPYFSSIVGQ